MLDSIMLPRARFRRPLATLIGAWFALFSAVAPVAAPCPMPHDAPGGSHAVHAGAQVTDPHDEHATTAHGPHGAPVDEDGPSEPHTPFRPCDCATSCCSVPVAALPAVPASVAIVPMAASAQIAREAPLVRAASRTRLLPFAQGPPA